MTSMIKNHVLFDSFIEMEFDFYGVDHHSFCIGLEGKRIIFEAKENALDGYRSFMECVNVKDLKGLIFFHEPIAHVVLKRVCPDKSSLRQQHRFMMTGYALSDTTNYHNWLVFGTDNYDLQYPMFVFNYVPKELKIEEFHNDV